MEILGGPGMYARTAPLEETTKNIKISDATERQWETFDKIGLNIKGMVKLEKMLIKKNPNDVRITIVRTKINELNIKIKRTALIFFNNNIMK